MKKLVLCLVKRKFYEKESFLCSHECPFINRDKEYCKLFERKLFKNYTVHAYNRNDKCLQYKERS